MTLEVFLHAFVYLSLKLDNLSSRLLDRLRGRCEVGNKGRSKGILVLVLAGMCALMCC